MKLSNANANYIGTGDGDIAWDAVAFVPGNYDKVPDPPSTPTSRQARTSAPTRPG